MQTQSPMQQEEVLLQSSASFLKDWSVTPLSPLAWNIFEL
jgi:hypothetical protein